MADLKVVIGVDDTAVLRGVDRVNKLERGYKRLDTAFNKGKITIQQYAQGVQQIDAAIKNMDTSIKRATASQERFENTSRKGMRRMEILAQQAGYQIGDLAVQIQSGTNAAVAFGQQGSQLLGFFGPAGAIAGAGLAIATGLIAPFLNARDAADDLTLSVDEISTALNKLTSRRQILTDLLTTPFLEGQETLQNYLEDLLEAEDKQLRVAVSLALGKTEGGKRTGLLADLQKDLEDAQAEIRQAQYLGYAAQGAEYDKLVSKAKLLEQQIKQIAFAIRGEAAEKRTVVENAEELLKIGQAYGGDLEKQINLILKETGLEEELLKLAQNRASAQKAINQQTSDILSAKRDQDEADRKAGEKEKDRLDNLRKQLDTLKDQTTFQENLVGLEGEKLIRQRGINAQRLLQLKYVKEGLAADDQSLRNAVRELGYLTDTQVAEYRRQQTLKKQAEQAERLAKAIEATARAAANFDSFMGKAGSKIPELRARLAVLRGGGTEAEAGIAGVREKALAEFQARAGTTGGGPPAIMALQSEYVAKKVEEAELEAQITAELNARRESQKKVKEDTLKSLMKDLELQKELLGMEENRASVIRALGEDRNKYTEKQINDAVILQTEIQKEIDLLEKQKAIIDFIGSSFETALMSIVDGTKSVEDAFRTMATEVIKELYRVLVVQKMVNAAKMAFGFADGGVIHNGNVVPYASGGVVGGPTYFPMSGGRTGLMGEAGPEAIMPLKRGKGGKLGVEVSGDTKPTVIHQNFNFAANGDESVKRMIAQAAPQIAKMTERGIMDSRRRGGQMKAVFG